jgi:long-subunit acyl-CoA synthetase (AMP-forming)
MFKLAQVNTDMTRVQQRHSKRLHRYFVFCQGEYVAPERIENIYIQSKYIAQVFVYGNGYKVN